MLQERQAHVEPGLPGVVPAVPDRHRQVGKRCSQRPDDPLRVGQEPLRVDAMSGGERRGVQVGVDAGEVDVEHRQVEGRRDRMVSTDLVARSAHRGEERCHLLEMGLGPGVEHDAVLGRDQRRRHHDRTGDVPEAEAGGVLRRRDGLGRRPGRQVDDDPPVHVRGDLLEHGTTRGVVTNAHHHNVRALHGRGGRVHDVDPYVGQGLRRAVPGADAVPVRDEGSADRSTHGTEAEDGDGRCGVRVGHADHAGRVPRTRSSTHKIVGTNLEVGGWR